MLPGIGVRFGLWHVSSVWIIVRGGGRALSFEVEPAIPPPALRLGLRFGAPVVEAASSFVAGLLGLTWLGSSS